MRTASPAHKQEGTQSIRYTIVNKCIIMSLRTMTIFAVSNTSKIEVARTSLIYTYYLAMQKMLCHSYLFQNCAKRVSPEQ